MVTTNPPPPAPAAEAAQAKAKQPGAGADWAAAEKMLTAYPTKYGSLNWIASRPLIAGLNHVLSLRTGGLVFDLRDAWVGKRAAQDLRIIEQPTTSWVVIGDTGEQDGSQYVVCRALSEFCRGGDPPDEAAKPGFMVVMSDVIYPAGDVEDYRFAVYHPYRLEDVASKKRRGPALADFTIKQPIYALPGNHDWYDGLSGFMYHFANRDPLPDAAYWDHWNAFHVPFRVMWRRARPASPYSELARKASP